MRPSHRRYKNEHTDGGGRYKPSDKTVKQEVVNTDSPIIKCFAVYASELDSKHDKYERIVKLSRDITIESKRIIFLLHTLDKDNKRNAVLAEAEKRLGHLESALFKSIGKELKGEDPYQFLRAYTSGMQEYAEALTFYHYLKHKKLQDWSSVQMKLMYKMENEENNKEQRKDDEENATDSQETSLQVLMPPSEYILGVADLTGELMRNCINCLGSGQLESCMKTCAFVKEIYNGFLGVGNSGPKEFSRKLYTLKQSLNKMENACYAICVRGSEIPKTMLADVLQEPGVCEVFEDEGFY